MVIRTLNLLNGGATHAKQPPTLAGVEELERDISFILGLMAIKTEHQQSICDADVLPTLVAIVARYSDRRDQYLAGAPAHTCRRAADAITNLAHENNSIKNRVRHEGGIPPLVSLLRTHDPKVQRAVAGTLRTLAFKNEENKDMIVELGALPLLIRMLRSEDTTIHYEAVGVIGNLVHSSAHIKQRVLEEGALQAVIDLLSSSCTESQREAALLLGQFATADGDYKSKIVQRGAVSPLIEMLSSSDHQLREMAAFALGRLAQHKDNQAGIMAMGGLPPLLLLLDSNMPNLQHNAAFALYGLSDNEDNLLHFIREGSIQRIQDCKLGPQASRDCVQKMTKRLQEKLLNTRILNQILYILQDVMGDQRRNIATALGLLCTAEVPAPDGLHDAMIHAKCLEILVSIVTEQQSISKDQQRHAAKALHTIATSCKAAAPAIRSPTPPDRNEVFLGSTYVNSKTLADVTFIVEGKEFPAHRIALLASSEIFKSMFDGNYKEKEAESIPIPNIRWPVFNAMMTCIYTGTVDVLPELAQELLEASDQYMLEKLKSLCEIAIASQLSCDNVAEAFDLAEAFNAPELAKSCIMYCLEKYEEITDHIVGLEEPSEGDQGRWKDKKAISGYAGLMKKMEHRLKDSLVQMIQNRVKEGEEGTEAMQT